jgi:hypothetical protein
MKAGNDVLYGLCISDKRKGIISSCRYLSLHAETLHDVTSLFFCSPGRGELKVQQILQFAAKKRQGIPPL